MASKNDFTQAAHAVFLQATGAAPLIAPTAKQLAGRKGGLKGGKARMELLTEAQRLELSAKGVAARKTPAFSGASVGKVKKSGA